MCCSWFSSEAESSSHVLVSLPTSREGNLTKRYSGRKIAQCLLSSPPPSHPWWWCSQIHCTFCVLVVHCTNSSQFVYHRIRPYSVECTRSRSISEVKQLQAGLVLGWVTAWEYPVPYPFFVNFCFVFHRKFWQFYRSSADRARTILTMLKKQSSPQTQLNVANKSIRNASSSHSSVLN